MAKITIPAVFGNNMVLQRGNNVPVWRKSDGAKVLTNDFAGYKTTATVNENSDWLARLPMLKAGGYYVMKIYSPKDTVTFYNVLMGDVWLASG